jgi:hypothetical protein
VARSRYPKSSGEKPPPLPPEDRTVGQVVAESIRVYGESFLRALPLGLPIAVVDQLQLNGTVAQRIVALVVFAPVFTAAYVYACGLASGRKPSRREWGTSLLAGSLVFLPAALTFPWFALASVLWLGLVSQVVPAAAIEGRSLRSSLRRGLALAKADYVHAAATLATLAILFGLTRIVLGFLLRSQADNTIRVSIFLADTVLGPILFIGAAMLYFDQAARAEIGTRRQRRKAAAAAAGVEESEPR